jgi:hypothetical protein
MEFLKVSALGLLFLVCGCSTSKPESESAETTSANCIEPENPYSECTGHYAGYEWAEKHDGATCNGNSQSFNEGCEEYDQQEEEYQNCERRKK